MPSKKALRGELLGLLSADLASLEEAQRATREGAIHEEAKAEDDKDTRAIEQSYLARGQAVRVEALRAGLAEVEAMPIRDFGEDQPVALGALVTVDEDGEERRIFIAPERGGSILAGGAVQVVTPKSPLGRALLGKRAEDEVEVALPGRTRRMVVLSVI